MAAKATISSFRVITAFVVLSIMGLAVIPLVNMQYQPNSSTNRLYVWYSWPNTSPEIIEREVTSKLEGMLAGLPNLTRIESESHLGRGNINLTFSEITDLQATRLEVSTMVRQLYSNFPNGVSYPQISHGGGSSGPKHLFTYTLNGKYSARELQAWAEETFAQALVDVRDVKEINVTGGDPMEWEIRYDRDKLVSLGLSSSDLQTAITTFLREEPLGVANVNTSNRNANRMMVRLRSARGDDIPWHRIPIKKVDERIIYLTSLGTVTSTIQEPQSFYRVNGLNSVNIRIYAAEISNMLTVGEEVKSITESILRSTPDGMQLTLVSDSTEYLRNELADISWRIALSIVILLLFVWLISRSLRYLLIVVISIAVNIALAFICYYALGIELHLYSLAGLTISLGIIIDNTIVMVDHIRLQKNKRVFLALLAATLTTVGSLSILYFLDREQQLELIDFAYVLGINLLLSLAVAWYLIPALLEKIPLKHEYNRKTIHSKRRVVRFNRVYIRVIQFIVGHKKLVLVLMVLAFGLPLYLLPNRLGDERQPKEELEWYQNLYNATLGNDWYQDNIHPYAKEWLGGALQLFHKSSYQGYYRGEPQRTVLWVQGSMPPGAHISQMNTVFMELENFISQFDEVERFETSISSINNASIKITFKPDYEFSAFPYYLKARLSEKAVSLGGMDSRIYGVGRGFSNALSTGYRDTNLYLYGYNYKNLLRIAEDLGDKLVAENDRIREVDILGSTRSFGGANYEYRMNLDNPQLTRRDLQPNFLYRFVQEIGLEERTVWRGMIGGELAQLKLRPLDENQLDSWNVNNYPLMSSDSSVTKLSELGTIDRQKAAKTIYKEDQQYRIVIAFDYIGSYQLKRRVVDRFLEETNDALPVGYFMQERQYSWRGSEATKYGLLALILVIIFVIGATLFESIRQPLVVLLIIPISFIGIFLTFYLFDIPFGQGGYAAMMLICGIAVNSGFFIINDYNNAKELHPHQSAVKLYLKAYQHKILPILLTICSTIAGMIPFLIEGNQQSFWFALAAGTVGGLVFSMVGVLVTLPFVVGRVEAK